MITISHVAQKERVVLAFALAQIADALTTAIGLQLGLYEMNPLAHNIGAMFVVKGVLTLCAIGILYLKRMTWMNWIVVILAAIPPLWNVLVITLELILI